MSGKDANQLDDVILRIVDIYLGARVLREWEKKAAARADPISEREMLALVVAEKCDDSQLLEKELARILGLAPASANDLVKRLLASRLIERSTGVADAREKPIKLSQRGRAALTSIRRGLCARYRYLFANVESELDAAHLPVLIKLLDCMKENVLLRLRQEALGGGFSLPPDELKKR